MPYTGVCATVLASPGWTFEFPLDPALSRDSVAIPPFTWVDDMFVFGRSAPCVQLRLNDLRERPSVLRLSLHPSKTAWVSAKRSAGFIVVGDQQISSSPRLSVLGVLLLPQALSPQASGMRSRSPERAPPRSGGLQGRAAWLLPVVTYDLASLLLLEAERDLVDRVWVDILGRSSSYRSPTTLPMAMRRILRRRVWSLGAAASCGRGVAAPEPVSRTGDLVGSSSGEISWTSMVPLSRSLGTREMEICVEPIGIWVSSQRRRDIVETDATYPPY